MDALASAPYPNGTIHMYGPCYVPRSTRRQANDNYVRHVNKSSTLLLHDTCACPCCAPGDPPPVRVFVNGYSMGGMAVSLAVATTAGGDDDSSNGNSSPAGAAAGGGGARHGTFGSAT